MFCYPEARRDEEVVEDYHGVKVSDPYRWLENPDAEDTKKFVNLQNQLTLPFLQQCPFKDDFNTKLTEMWNYPKYGCPHRHGDKWYYFHNTGLQNQSVLYVQDTLQSEGRVFLDPNEMSADGTTALSSYSFSEDGKFMAYSFSHSGSDWVSIKVRDTETGKDLVDEINNCKFSCLSWTHDHKGFFYNLYSVEEQSKADGTETDANFNQLLCYHVIGTEVKQDVVCAMWPDNPRWLTSAIVSDCGNYVLCSISEGCEPVNRVYVCHLSSLSDGIKGILPFKKVIDNFDAEYSYITNDGSVFTFKTNLNASNYKIVTLDVDNQEEPVKTLVEEHAQDVLEWACCVNGDKIFLSYLHDVKSKLIICSLQTGEEVACLPLDIGTVVSLSGERKYSEILYQFTSFLTPGIIYYLDLDQQPWIPKVHKKIELKDFETDLYETRQVFYPAKDDPNIQIPMFIISRKDLQLDGSHAVLLYGYGGFSISISPSFSVSRIIFMNNMSGVIAIPNIRGGGEYGEKWHKAGSLRNKQNVFNDFQAAAEYLIEHKYTNPKKLAIMGGSNGGLLVAACANQRPDLFACVVGQMGVMDMLRFHRFTIGHAWITEFGSADDKEDFEYLLNYSPLHNVPKDLAPGTQYPATILFTGDHDDRVVPLHTLKLIAQLQHSLGASPNQTNPLMVRVDTKSGHGAGKPTSKIIEECTDMYTFLAICMGLQWKA